MLDGFFLFLTFEFLKVQHVNRGLLPSLPLTCAHQSRMQRLAALYPDYEEGLGKMVDMEDSDEGVFGDKSSNKIQRSAKNIFVAGIKVKVRVLSNFCVVGLMVFASRRY